MTMLKMFIDNEEAATAIEYGLLAALIGVGMLASLKVMNNGIIQNYEFWTNAVVAETG